MTTFAHTNNTLFELDTPYTGIATADPTEMLVDPGYDTTRYGDGAYLIRNAMGTGAEVLFQVESGVVTDKPLWPWPLEDRIREESGTSVTWESGGGIWRELPEDLLEEPLPECP